MNTFSVVKPLLHALEPETAHGVTIKLLQLSQGLGLPLDLFVPRTPDSLKQKLWNLNFKHPVGLAAGFDKNGQVFPAMLELGMSHVEVGTITPKPQLGNPKPRCFRLPEQQAMINRFGFNGVGVLKAAETIRYNTYMHKTGGIVGINVGKNKDTVEAHVDYVYGLSVFHSLADYLVINVSSPNTPGLRDLQKRNALEALIKPCAATVGGLNLKSDKHVPLLVKIAPDLNSQEIEDIVGVCSDNSIDGLIVSNTTMDRPDYLPEWAKSETGGFSGDDYLLDKSNQVLARCFSLTKGSIPLIGVGGVSSPMAAWSKICAGASLVQLYTALIYQGMGLVYDLNKFIAKRLSEEGVSSISEVIGCRYQSFLQS